MKSVRPSSGKAECVEAAVVGDEEAIYSLIVDAFGDSYLRFTVFQSLKSMEHIRAMIESMTAPGGPAINVVRQNQRVVAFYAAKRRADEFFLNYIATCREQRANGTGTELLAHFERKGQALGCRRLGLEVFASNKAAYAWYHRHHYVAVSHLWHLRFSAAAIADNNSDTLTLSRDDLESALLEEATRGFSSVPGEMGTMAVRIGLIAGNACKILEPTGRSAMDVARAAATRFNGLRSWFLVTTREPLPEAAVAESVEEAVYLTKRCVGNSAQASARA